MLGKVTACIELLNIAHPSWIPFIWDDSGRNKTNVGVLFALGIPDHLAVFNLSVAPSVAVTPFNPFIVVEQAVQYKSPVATGRKIV